MMAYTSWEKVICCGGTSYDLTYAKNEKNLCRVQFVRQQRVDGSKSNKATSIGNSVRRLLKCNLLRKEILSK